MRLISNATIVLTSREILIKLIKIAGLLHRRKSSNVVVACLPPPATPLRQYEFELLQMLDVLYHTTSLSTYKTLVRSLLSSATTTTTTTSVSRLIVARMACLNILPEFKLVKRESWSSEEKHDRDRGRVRRTRWKTDGGSAVEEAVQFTSTSTSTGAGSTAAAASNSIGSLVIGLFLKHATDQVDSAGVGAAGTTGPTVTSLATNEIGYKPNDIERLTSPDSSNLLVMFDTLSHPHQPGNKSSSTKPPINIDYFKR